VDVAESFVSEELVPETARNVGSVPVVVVTFVISFVLLGEAAAAAAGKE
jgi:hypothetical protein